MRDQQPRREGREGPRDLLVFLLRADTAAESKPSVTLVGATGRCVPVGGGRRASLLSSL